MIHSRLTPLFFGLSLLLFSSCVAYHHGSMAGSGLIDPAYRPVRLVYGQASAVRYLNIGGLGKDALVLEARKSLLESARLQPGQVLANYTVDFKESFYFYLAHVTEVVVSAEVLEAGPATALTDPAPEPGYAGYRPGDPVRYRTVKVDGNYVKAQVVRVEADHLVLVYTDRKGVTRFATADAAEVVRE